MADAREFLFANNASCGLGSDLTAAATSIALETGKGSLFPSPVSGQIFKLTLQNILNGAFEIVNVTGRAGDALTVERGAEGTTPQAFPAATTLVQLRITSETLQKLQESGGGAGGGAPSNAGYLVYAADGALSNEKVLVGEAGIFSFNDEGAALRLVLGANSITDAKLRQGAATSVVGRAANTSGNLADIAAGADGDVLRRAAGVLGFGAIPQSSVTGLPTALTDLSNQISALSSSTTAALVGKVDTSLTIATQHSLTGGGNLTSSRTLHLVGDVAAPGANKFYGTDGSGVRGWYSQIAGVTDHGALTGLADDDHTQYYNQTRGDARYLQLAGGTITGVLTVGNGGQVPINAAGQYVRLLKAGASTRSAFIAISQDASFVNVEAQFEADGSTPRVILGSSTNHPVEFRTNNVARMTLSAAGVLNLASTPTVGGTAVSLSTHAHAFADITSKPTTLAGYGITDGVATTRQVATANSLTGGGDLSSNRTLTLVGDVASPGSSKYYGTDSSGVRGWYDSATIGVTTGSFTGTLGGVSSGGSGTVNYRIVGGVCTLWIVNAISGPSNSAGLGLNGLPVEVRPSSTRICGTTVVIAEGIADSHASCSISPAGSISFVRASAAASAAAVPIRFGGVLFSSDGSVKGLPAGWSVTYPL